MAIRLLALPPKALRRVIQNIRLQELISLAQCSTRMRELIRKVYLETPSSITVQVVFQEGAYTLWIYHPTSCLTFFFYSTHTISPQLPQVHMAPVQVAGKTIEFESCAPELPPNFVVDSFSLYYYEADHREQLFIDLIWELMELFNLNLQVLSISLEHLDFMEPLLMAPWLWKCDQLVVQNGSVSEREMTWILKNHRCKKLQMLCSVSDTYKYSGTISASTLNLENFPLSRRQLLDFNCEKIVFKDHKLTNKDYNAFVKQWMEGTDRKLIFLINLFDDDRIQLDEEKILEGVKWYPGRQKSYDPIQEGNLPYRTEYYLDGLDLFRADGKMATLLVRNRTPGMLLSELIFVVWHQKNADVVDEYYGLNELFYLR